jgi:CheY-like chemotaxis protein
LWSDGAVSHEVQTTSVEQVRLSLTTQHERLEWMAAAVSRLGHDFNNILAGVMGFIELSMVNLPAESPIHPFLKEAFEAAQAGCTYTKQLSLFSKRSGAHWPGLDLAALITEECARHQGAWGAKTVLHLSLEDNLPPVCLDRERARHVLSALLTNAFEAIPEGVGSVIVSAVRSRVDRANAANYLGDVQNGTHVELIIEDTGAGFSAEAKDKVFVDLFYTGRQRHRGLGLLTSYGILHNCKGGIRIEHASESGTRVHVLIPTAATADSEQTLLCRPTTFGTTAEKVLVVEDDPSMLQLIRKTLEGAGYQVCSAKDGEQALNWIESAADPFNLVLSDVIMPRMSGFDLADQIRSRQPRVPILLTSGKMSAGFVPNRFVGRHYSLLPKPFPPETLLEAVRSALRNKTELTSPPGDHNCFEDKTQIPAEVDSSSK